MTMPYEPMLCKPQDEMYLDKFNDTWVAEIKYDGERILAQRVAGEIQLWTRRNRNVAFQFPEIVDALQSLPEMDWIVDGELTVEGGFEKLLTRNIKSETMIKLAAQYTPATYNVFDVLKLGENLMVNNVSLKERRDILDALVAEAAHPRIKLALQTRGTGAKQLFALITGADGEGIVLKRLDSKYLPGSRTSDWFKIKKMETVDVHVIGATESEALPFGSLVIAKNGKYYGKVGTGFTDAMRGQIIEKLRANPDTHDFGRWKVPHDVKREMIQVCSPLAAEVKILENHSSGSPRHPVWIRWRE